MKGENNQMKNSGERTGISNSRAMGVIVLIALLFVFQIVTFVLQKVRGAGADVGEGSASESVVGGVPKGAGRFRFNPNTITLDSLVLLGFTPRQAQSVLNYRDKGGVFRRREDFSRLYVVDSAMYHSLKEYIFIPDRNLSGTGNVVAAGPVRKRGDIGTGNGPGVDLVSEKGVSGTGNEVAAGPVRKRGDIGTGNGPGVDLVSEKGVSGTGNAPGNSSGKVPGKVSGKVPGNVSGGSAGDGIYGGKVERNRYVCNLNTADSAALVGLYGIGGYYARKILEYRERLGGSFVHKRQLLEIEGLRQETYDRIENSIVVNPADVRGFSLLEADRRALERHPYIGPYAARGIITYIRLKGKSSFSSNLELLEKLVEEHIITENNALRLREYLLHL